MLQIQLFIWLKILKTLHWGNIVFIKKYLKSFKVFWILLVYFVLPVTVLSPGCSLVIRVVQKLHLSQHHCCASYQCWSNFNIYLPCSALLPATPIWVNMKMRRVQGINMTPAPLFATIPSPSNRIQSRPLWGFGIYET